MNNIKKMPVFRGRFGIRSVRRKSNKKWQRWRFPRGIDILWKRGQIRRPDVGFGCDKKYRDLHPSGRIEVYVKNLTELESHVEEHKKNTNDYIYRVASTLGAKKRMLIKAFADKHGLRMINVKDIPKKVKIKKKEKDVNKDKNKDAKKDDKKVENKEKTKNNVKEDTKKKESSVGKKKN